MEINGSESVIKCLIEEEVDTIYGYPGGAIMPIYDALYHYQKEINHVLVRHEQEATHAAQGYARASGKSWGCICHIWSGSYQPNYRHSRCANRFYTHGLYYRTSSFPFIRLRCFSRN